MKDKLKIGIVCYPTYGGSGVVATELGIAFAEKGHEVHFISYDQPFRLELFSDKIYYHEVNIPSYPLFEYTPYELNLTSKLVDVTIHERRCLVTDAKKCKIAKINSEIESEIKLAILKKATILKKESNTSTKKSKLKTN